MALLFALAAIAAIAWGYTQARSLHSTRNKLNDYAQKYHPAIKIDEYVQEREKRIKELLAEEGNVQSQIDLAKAELSRRRDLIDEEVRIAEKELQRINEELDLMRDTAVLADIGYYEPRYDFEDVPSYEAELKRIREKQKAMLREDGVGHNAGRAAAFATESLTYNGSAAQGRAAQKKTLKLMLRAFNGESDSFISRVNYRNVETMEKRIYSAFSAINAITEKYDRCKLNPRYLDLRIEELNLVYEWEEAKQREKEEQAKIREQMREEERAAREAEKAKQQAEKEEAKYQELLAQAQLQVQKATAKDKAKLNSKIEELQQRIAEIEEKKRKISQAMLTKTGHVYIISNVGSFGENVYKIGMTRRLEPMDRVKELGDASVPFPFDVHAMIRTGDAPALENELHKHFDQRRLNLENQRKEFFRVSIDEIRQELDDLKESLGIESELRLTLLAEAKEYRMSEAKRRHLEAG